MYAVGRKSKRCWGETCERDEQVGFMWDVLDGCMVFLSSDTLYRVAIAKCQPLGGNMVWHRLLGYDVLIKYDSLPTSNQDFL